MNLLNIKTFLYVVRYQSFSGAAQAMYTSQPAISSRLSQLEEELGFQLVTRKKGYRTIELTAKGQAFISLAEHWLELDRRTIQFCREGNREPLTLVAPGSLQEHVIPQIMYKLLDLPEPPRLQLRTASSKAVYSMVSSREAEVGLALRLVQQDGTVAIPLFDAETMLLCPADTPLPDEKIHPDQLDPRYEVSITSWTGDVRRWHDQHWDPYAIPYVQVDNNHMTHNYMRHPNCWAICPAEIAISLLARDNHSLTIRQLDATPPKHICYLVVARSQLKNKPESIQQLHRAILEYADGSPWLRSIRSQQRTT